MIESDYRILCALCGIFLNLGVRAISFIQLERSTIYNNVARRFYYIKIFYNLFKKNYTCILCTQIYLSN